MINLLFILVFFIHVFVVCIEDLEKNETIRKNGQVSPEEIKITPFGYVKAENYFDSRQVFGFADDQSLYFPLPKRYDLFCRDINAHPQSHMLALETTVGLNLSPVEISQGLRVKGFIEGFFAGRQEEIGINHWTAYRNYLQLETNHFELLTGQYWHPLFIDDCYPKTISFANGVPVESQDWEPQIRFTGKNEKWLGSITFLTELDSTSLGPEGYSSKYIRNSATPNINFFIKRIVNKHFFGATLDYKRLIPRIVTDTCYKTDESVNSFIGALFAALDFERWRLRLKCMYAQNGTAMGLISGYGVATENPITHSRTYTPTSALCAWADGDYTITGKNTVTFGCFCGFTQNLGSTSKLCIDAQTGQPIVYAICPQLLLDIKLMPRIVLKTGPVDIAAELQFDHARFGRLNSFGKPVNTLPVNSVRLLLAAYYRF